MWKYAIIVWIVSLAVAFSKGYSYHDQTSAIKRLQAENKRLALSQSYYRQAAAKANQTNKDIAKINEDNEAIINELRSQKPQADDKPAIANGAVDDTVILGSWLRGLDKIK